MEKFTLKELKEAAAYLNDYFFPFWVFFFVSKEEASFFAETLDRVISQLELFLEGREFMFSANDVQTAYKYVQACLEEVFQEKSARLNDKEGYRMLSRAANFLESLYKTMNHDNDEL